MAAPCFAGSEQVAHGTLATVLRGVGNLDMKPGQKNRILNEQRASQDADINIVAGRQWEEWSIKDSFVYHDTFGTFLNSAIGKSVESVIETTALLNTFKFTDDPASISLQTLQPRRALMGYQSLGCVVDKLQIKFAADGDLTWNASGIGLMETAMSISTPAITFSSTLPFNVWDCAVTLGGGANARLVSGDITISRERKQRSLLSGTQAATIGIGNRSVDYNLVVDFDNQAEYTKYKAATNDALTMLWTQNAVTIGASTKPYLSVKLGTLAYVEAAPDTDTDLPTLKVSGKGLYNVADASTIVVLLASTINYQTG
jgi:Phage tail tube protein